MMEGCLQEHSAGGRAECACWQAAGRALSRRRGQPRPKVGCKKTIPGPARRVTLTLAVSHSHHLRPGQVAHKITHGHGHLAHPFILAEAPLLVPAARLEGDLAALHAGRDGIPREGEGENVARHVQVLGQ